jgi:WD40 repeat protein
LHQSDNGRTQGVGGQTDALRYSPDGKLLASGHGATTGETRILRIWDSNTGAIVRDIDDRFGSVSSIDRSPYEFSPDGRFLIRLDRGGPRTDIPLNMPLDTLIVYDAKTWQIVWTLATPGYSPTGLALNRAGDRAALSGWERRERGGKGYLQYKLVIVDLLGRALRRSFEIPSGNMDVLAWNPDGKRIVLVGNEVVVVDVSTGEVLAEYPSNTLPVGVKYTPDGKRLLIARFDSVEIWDGEHTKLLQKIPVAFVNVMCLSSDGRYMAFAQEAQVGIWKLK